MVTSSIGGGNNQPIVFAGLMSGIDTKSLIQQMLDAQKGPIQAMQAKVAARQQQSGAIGDINTRLTNLLSLVRSFDDATYLQGKTASVAAGSGSATVSATATATATAGSFKVTVDQLATATHVSSPSAIGAAVDPDAVLQNANLAMPITAGTFTVNGVSISVDPTVDTLTDVMQRIQSAVPGVTVSLVADPSGRANRLQIAGGAPVTLGAGGDTSNFLSATNLLASPGGAIRTSTMNVGVARTGASLSSADLVTPLSTATGSFTVNGVQISWDSSQDSLSTVLSRINNSTAGVVASYDAATDTVTLVNKTTGSTAIQLQDTAGNFLAAIGLAGTTQTLGTNAQVEIDTGNGPVTYYSTSNTLTNAVPGVTLNLLATGTSADTVTVGQDVDGAVSKMKNLVAQVNSALDFIRTQTAIDTKTNINGPLAGDSTISQIGDAVRSLLMAPIDGVTTGKTSLADLGLSFGAVGSSPGSTNTLTLDEAKFRAALQSDPAGVANVLSAFGASASLNAGGTGGVQSVAGAPTKLRVPGTYQITTSVNGDGTANITAVFTPSDGGPSQTTTANNVAAGSTNTSLIAGVTLTFKGAFTAGTDTITIGTPTRGIASKLEQYLDPLTRAGGALAQRQETMADGIQDMNDQIQRMNDRLAQQQQQLQDKFAQMEIALARLQDQRSSLTALAQAVAAGGG